MIRLSLLGISAAVAAGILFVNVYNSLIDAPNWGVDLPNSVQTARHYFSVANPGSFFRIISPINQVLAAIAVFICWKFRRERYIAIGSLVLTILADVLTFGYFYPRLDVLFAGPIDVGTDALRMAWEQWSAMNWFRSAMCAVNVVLAFILLTTTSKRVAL